MEELIERVNELQNVRCGMDVNNEEYSVVWRRFGRDLWNADRGCRIDGAKLLLRGYLWEAAEVDLCFEWEWGDE